LRQEVIWDKSVRAKRQSAGDRATRTHENIFMFTKQRRYFYNPDQIREPHKSAVDYRYSTNPMGRNPESVVRIQTDSYRGRHTATFPPELVRRMLLPSCDDNAVVLDPFGGAGTTAMVALQLGFSAITIDINPDYTEEARDRIARAAVTYPMDDDEDLAPDDGDTTSDTALAAD